MPAISVRVLLFEDNPADVLLLQHMLDQDALVAFRLTVVERLAIGLELLRSQMFDAILVDLGLPDSQGLATFEQVRQQAPDIPVVVLSGTSDELQAVQAVQSGAQDYLVKGQSGWDLAARAIRYAIERQQVQRRLIRSEELYRSLVESSNAGISTWDLRGRCHYINHVEAARSGKQPEEMVGRDLHELLPPELAALLQESIRTVLMHGEGIEQEISTLLNGRPYWLRTSIQPVRDIRGIAVLALVNSTDITEQKQASEALRRSEEQHRTLFETMVQGVVYRGADGRVIDANPAAQQILGLTLAQLQEQAPLDPGWRAIREDGTEINRSNHPEMIALHTGRPIHDAVVGILDPQTNEYRWILTQVLPKFFPGDTNPYQVYATLEDITERRRIEAARKEIEQMLERRVQERTAEIEATRHRLELATRAGNIGVWEYNLVEQRLFWDADMCVLYGIPPEQFDQKLETWQRVLHPDDVSSGIDRLNQALEQGRYSDEFRILRNNGDVRIIQAYADIVYNDAGVPASMIGVNIDVTEQRESARALRESEERARLLFEESPVAVVLTDMSGVIRQVNRSAAELTGIPRAELEGMNIYESGLVPRRSRDEEAGLRQIIASGQRKLPPIEFTIHRLDGEVREAEASSFPIHLAGEQFLLSAIRDITAHKQAESMLRRSEEMLRHANTELERALRLKDEFLANMSHELRTPLNGILALSEALLEQTRGPLNERQVKSLQSIEASGRHLLTLINDILDLAKIEAGKLELQIEPVVVGDLCQISMSFVKELASKKQVALAYPLTHDLTIHADSRRLKQILINLLTNAVKFTPSGGRVTLKVVPYPDRSAVEFVVEDTGIGIEPQYLDRLFSPFTQLDSSLSKQHEGSGLGLALVKRLAELHGGSVAVQSTPGHGSRFFVILPYQSAEEPPIASPDLPPIGVHNAAPQHQAPRGVILLADDNEINVEVVRDYLEDHAYQVIVAHNGAEVLTEVEVKVPDLILMDIQMPVIDGLETIRNLRSNPRFAHTPIIALTALAMPGDRERCLAAGADEYISKPISLRALEQHVVDWMKRRRST